MNLERGKGMVLLTVSLMTLSGCMFGSSDIEAPIAVPAGAVTEPSLEPEYEINAPEEGSLWTGKNSSVFEDTKANYVGDTVIVDIVENASSEMDVNTESSRKSEMGIGVPTLNFMGYKTQLGGRGTTNLVSTDFSNTFSGEGKNDRSGKVTASIAARVTEVLPNGNLSIYGRRAMKVDHETQYIVVSGVVRPQDISAGNRVESTYLADSKIEYYGKGALSDKQKPGWGSRIIDNIWPW